MEIQELARVIGQRWRIVGMAMLLSVVLALSWSLASPVNYRATGRVIIATSGSLGTASDAYSGEQVSVQRAPTYAQLLTGREVAARAAEKLHGAISPQTIQDSIDAQITARLPMVVITATSRNANEAVQIVAAAEQGLQEYVKEIERPGKDGSLTSVVLSGDPPVVTRVNHSVRNATIAGLIGLLLGIILAVYRDRTDPIVKSGGQVTARGFVYRGTVAADAEPAERAEALRRIAVGLLCSEELPAARILVVGVDRECDTVFTSRGLGSAMAACGRPVTIVDGVGLHGPERRPGLSDVFADSLTWRRCLLETTAPNLYEIGYGTKGVGLDVLLLDGRDMKQRLPLDDPREQIVIAAPSIVHSPVAVALTTVADAALLVVRRGQSKVSDVDEAKTALEAMGVRSLGMILVTGEAAADGGLHVTPHSAASPVARNGQPVGQPAAQPTARNGHTTELIGPLALDSGGRHHRHAVEVGVDTGPLDLLPASGRHNGHSPDGRI
jgi:capsular polysaccharide biosynthesis protein